MHSFYADLLTSFSFDFLFWSYTSSANFEITAIYNALKIFSVSVYKAVKRIHKILQNLYWPVLTDDNIELLNKIVI